MRKNLTNKDTIIKDYSNMKANILSKEIMEKNGFTEHDIKNEWCFCEMIMDDYSLNVFIPKNGADIKIFVLDEFFCEPYDYIRVLKASKKLNINSPRVEVAKRIQKGVDVIIKKLQKIGILEKV